MSTTGTERVVSAHHVNDTLFSFEVQKAIFADMGASLLELCNGLPTAWIWSNKLFMTQISAAGAKHRIEILSLMPSSSTIFVRVQELP